mmetsp:Transcript_9869/g.20524  ORF Transcript_9869/g.20524 Transcript_9869/m.20524 type:complete len:111 (-) Transcript_9869:144-476(-)
MKDSQNGFDNSGQAMGFQWTTALNSEYITEQTFEHWPIRDARWIGSFDQEKAEYTSINYENIQHSLEVIEAIVQRYKSHPAVQALEVCKDAPKKNMLLVHSNQFLKLVEV